jgi:hypothetical protein
VLLWWISQLGHCTECNSRCLTSAASTQAQSAADLAQCTGSSNLCCQTHCRKCVQHCCCSRDRRWDWDAVAIAIACIGVQSATSCTIFVCLGPNLCPCTAHVVPGLCLAWVLCVERERGLVEWCWALSQARRACPVPRPRAPSDWASTVCCEQLNTAVQHHLVTLLCHAQPCKLKQQSLAG